MIFFNEMHQTLLLFFTFAGFLISILSILEKYLKPVASFCSFFGEGCRKTADFSLFGIPISWWGAVFYLALAVIIFIAKPLIFWIVMAALGIELTFIWIMISIKIFCIFCIFNAITVTGLVLLVLNPEKIWQALSTGLIFFLIFKYLLYIENVFSLKETRVPLERIRIKGSPSLGPDNAPVTVVEFSNYLCPACRAAHITAIKIKERFKGKIRWIFKDFPLQQHSGAKKMAIAAHCAGEQGKFWEYQDMLFASEGKTDTDLLKKYASDLALDLDRFDKCLESGRHLERIERDIENGKEVGISGTPTFIINEKMKAGASSFNKFKKIIEGELKKIKK